MANSPAVALSYAPPGPQFNISEACEMPDITVTATLRNVTPNPKTPPQFHWKITLVFRGQRCAHSLSRVIQHPPIDNVTQSNTLVIPFTKVRGGDLTVAVTVKVGALTLTAHSHNLEVVGKNPSVPALHAYVNPTDAFKKLMRVESELLQFRSPACPLFSSDNFGGVGICQVTGPPPPTDDQVWSWKANVDAGWQIYLGKQSIATAHPASVRKSHTFQALVKAYNDQRMAKARAAAHGKPVAGKPVAGKPVALKPLVITLPDYTAEQLQRDTIRGYNGYAGSLHEYRIRVDANGLLVVTEDPKGATGTAEWEEVPVADRIKHYNDVGITKDNWGDPDYVNHVEAKASF